MEIIHVIPDSPTSVLELFQPSKEGIVSFSSQVISAVEDGRVDPLRVRILCKAMTEIADKIDKGTKDNQAREAEKNGERPFIMAGCELQYAPVKTEYDFSRCNDAVLNRLLILEEEIAKQVKQRKDWLRTMAGQEVLVDEATGEQYTAYPPIKRTTMGVKVSIK